jgi:hypothetical protein
LYADGRISCGASDRFISKAPQLFVILTSTKKQTIVERMNPMMIGDIAGLLWQDAIKRDHQLDGDIWMGIYLIGNLKALPLYHLQLPYLIALKFVKGIGVLDIEG